MGSRAERIPSPELHITSSVGCAISRSGEAVTSRSPPTPHSGYLDAADARTQSPQDPRRLRDIVQKSMRIQSTDDRDRLWENLCEATGESARSKALDRAARYYLRMCGGVAAYGRGDIQTLLDEAEAQGSLTAPEIAAILDERELPVTYETTSSVGPE
uniref:Uncharacterized protein n=1 Tax=uncultured virus TaxID=340016 RepID=D5L2I9_9VIRU|nr:hypothetical protein [uncultured virus]